MTKPKTKAQLKKIDEISTANNKTRWLCVCQSFKCKMITLERGWYELVGSHRVGETWNHDIKLKDSKEYLKLSETDYQKIITNFDKENTHLK